jgi:hypothetical protein
MTPARKASNGTPGGHGRAPVNARSTASCSRSDHDIPPGRERARSRAIPRKRSRSSSDSAAHVPRRRHDMPARFPTLL